MGNSRMVVEELLSKEKDSVLLDIQKELLSLVMPKRGFTREYCRKINHMIDDGEICINPDTYRRMYAPTLAKAVQREMARRYVNYLENMKSM